MVQMGRVSWFCKCWTGLAVRKLIEFITFFEGEGKNRNHKCNPMQSYPVPQITTKGAQPLGF